MDQESYTTPLKWRVKTNLSTRIYRCTKNMMQVEENPEPWSFLVKKPTSGASWMGARGEMAIIGVGSEDVAGDIVVVEAGPCAEVGGGGVKVIGLGFDYRNKGFGSETFSLSGRSYL
jgi:hypothetical protein